ncbi:MAG: PaaI family thioesterase [Candidatus Omnitrophica bacterium]|nr:PaaI family thioesterase [Candidatus Omnitrophota bacterium]
MSKTDSNKVDKIKLEDDFMCFVCGKHNSSGLGLTFQLDGNTMKTEFTPKKVHQGFANITHGGIIATVLDEVMLNLLYRKNIYALTAELGVRFRKSSKVGEKLFFSSTIDEKKGKIIKTSAQAKNSNGQMIASAQAKCIVVA